MLQFNAVVPWREGNRLDFFTSISPTFFDSDRLKRELNPVAPLTLQFQSKNIRFFYSSCSPGNTAQSHIDINMFYE